MIIYTFRTTTTYCKSISPKTTPNISLTYCLCNSFDYTVYSAQRVYGMGRRVNVFSTHSQGRKKNNIRVGTHLHAIIYTQHL